MSSMHSTVRSSGRVITGGVVSTIVIVWVMVVLFPQLSVAVHDRVMISTSGQSSAMLIELATTTSTSSSQLSVAGMVSIVGISSPHSIVRSSGCDSNTGASVSEYVMVCMHSA